MQTTERTPLLQPLTTPMYQLYEPPITPMVQNKTWRQKIEKNIKEIKGTIWDNKLLFGMTTLVVILLSVFFVWGIQRFNTPEDEPCEPTRMQQMLNDWSAILVLIVIGCGVMFVTVVLKSKCKPSADAV